ncbi:MAG: TadE/TadG family type IV pilus assembly protein [Mariniblastus sp.]|nr:TadE/TadG family type IV pilus assembly protein [Mariniblastus sp.]
MDRRGAAAVEAAILLPVFVFIFLAMIDIGQAVLLRHTVENASREAARMASKNATESVTEVHLAVVEHLQNAYPNVESTSMVQAVSTSLFYVDTSLGGNTTYAPQDLTEIPSGEAVHVTVSLDFDAVRWLPGFELWTSAFFETKSVCRRE